MVEAAEGVDEPPKGDHVQNAVLTATLNSANSELSKAAFCDRMGDEESTSARTPRGKQIIGSGRASGSRANSGLIAPDNGVSGGDLPFSRSLAACESQREGKRMSHDGSHDVDVLRTARIGSGASAGALLEFDGCKILIGCPWHSEAELLALGLAPSDLDAVLLTSAQSDVGIAEFLSDGKRLHTKDAGSPWRGPRILGTTPVLVALEARLADMAAAAAWEAALDPAVALADLRTQAAWRRAAGEGVEALMDRTQEVSFGEQVTIEGPGGPVVVTAACSGYGLGGCYWTVHAMGIRVVALGASTWGTDVGGFCCREADVQPLLVANILVLLGGACDIARSAPRVASSVATAIADLAEGAEALLKAGRCVVIPVDGEYFPWLVDVVEALGQKVASLPREAQAPIFALGGIARFLRKCGSFAEWAQCARLEATYGGSSPFLLDGLRAAKRLALADTLLDLRAVFREPFIALMPALGFDDLGEAKEPRTHSAVMAHVRALLTGSLGAARTELEFEVRGGWGGNHSKLQSEALIAVLGEAVSPIVETTVAMSAVSLPAHFSARCTPSVLDSGGWTRVPVDLEKPRMSFWLPANELRLLLPAFAAAKRGRGHEAAELCAVQGFLVLSKRPRLAAAPESAALVAGSADTVPVFQPVVGEVKPDAFVAALSTRGHAGAWSKPKVGTSGTLVEVPSLRATVLLNHQRTFNDVVAAPLESVIRAPSAAARRLLREALAEAVL